MAPVHDDALTWQSVCLLADTIVWRWCRLRTGGSIGHLLWSFAHGRGRLSPLLSGLQPSRSFLFLLLLPCLCLLMFLKGLSGSFRHY
jgi:hypothetical protein